MSPAIRTATRCLDADSALLWPEPTADCAELQPECPAASGGGFPDWGPGLCDHEGMTATGPGAGPLDPDRVRSGKQDRKRNRSLPPCGFARQAGRATVAVHRTAGHQRCGRRAAAGVRRRAGKGCGPLVPGALAPPAGQGSAWHCGRGDGPARMRMARAGTRYSRFALRQPKRPTLFSTLPSDTRPCPALFCPRGTAARKGIGAVSPPARCRRAVLRRLWRGRGQPCSVLTPISPSRRAFIAATAETAPAAVVK